MGDKKITELTEKTGVSNDDWVAVVDTEVTPNVTKKAKRSEFKGDKGNTGLTGETGARGEKGEKGDTGTAGINGTNGTNGVNAYVYIAYASDASGTDFTMTFDEDLDYIAIKTTTVAIASPQASDFAGLWKNYKGAAGAGIDFSDNEVVGGTIDGNNAEFILAHAPSPGSSLILILNGAVQTQGIHYTLSGLTITYLAAPALDLADTSHRAHYRY